MQDMIWRAKTCLKSKTNQQNSLTAFTGGGSKKVSQMGFPFFGVETENRRTFHCRFLKNQADLVEGRVAKIALKINKGLRKPFCSPHEVEYRPSFLLSMWKALKKKSCRAKKILRNILHCARDLNVFPKILILRAASRNKKKLSRQEENGKTSRRRKWFEKQFQPEQSSSLYPRKLLFGPRRSHGRFACTYISYMIGSVKDEVKGHLSYTANDTVLWKKRLLLIGSRHRELSSSWNTLFQIDAVFLSPLDRCFYVEAFSRVRDCSAVVLPCFFNKGHKTMAFETTSSNLFIWRKNQPPIFVPMGIHLGGFPKTGATPRKWPLISEKCSCKSLTPKLRPTRWLRDSAVLIQGAFPQKLVGQLLNARVHNSRYEDVSMH